MSIEKDLIEQAGLDKEDIKQDLGFFKYKERPVIVSHKFAEHLVVSIEGEDNEEMNRLIRGLSKVVGYEPFCKYMLRIKGDIEHILLPTYEWDKVNPTQRYQELISKDSISNLEKL